LRELRRMNSKLKDEHTDRLFEAILLLKNMEECYDFFEDVCTIPELKAPHFCSNFLIIMTWNY